MYANTEIAASIAAQQMLPMPTNMPGEGVARIYVIEGNKAEPETRVLRRPGADFRRSELGVPRLSGGPTFLLN